METPSSAQVGVAVITASPFAKICSEEKAST
jgi:hypothetical protein